MIIIYNKYTFFANNRIQRAWTCVRDTFLQLKKRNQGIIVSDFFLLFRQLNLSLLSEEK